MDVNPCDQSWTEGEDSEQFLNEIVFHFRLIDDNELRPATRECGLDLRRPPVCDRPLSVSPTKNGGGSLDLTHRSGATSCHLRVMDAGEHHV
jgi:hypothetical protein